MRQATKSRGEAQPTTVRRHRVTVAGGKTTSPIYSDSLQKLRQAIYWTLEEPSVSSEVPRYVTMGVASINVAMIVLGLVSLIMETMPKFADTPDVIWYTIECVTSGAFLVEYLLRFWVCDIYGVSAVTWVLKPMNVADVLAISPVFFELLVPWDVTFLRVLRVVRLFKIGRYSQGVRVMNAALANSMSALYILVFLFLIGSVIFASIVYFTERLSCPDFRSSTPNRGLDQFLAYSKECDAIGDSHIGTCCAYMCNVAGNMSEYFLCKQEWREDASIKIGRRLSEDWEVEALYELEMDSVLTGMWWAAVTMTTVGYGDITPKNWISKIFASAAMLSGMLIIAMPFAIVGTKFSEAAAACQEEFDSILEEEPGSPSSVPRTKEKSEELSTALADLRKEIQAANERKKEILKLQQLRDNLWTSVEHSMVGLAFEGAISYSAEMIDGPWVPEKMEDKLLRAFTKNHLVQLRTGCETTCGFIPRDWTIRRFAIKITQHWLFEGTILTAIIVNSFILASISYYPGQEDHWGNKLQNGTEAFFSTLFTLECILKVLAMGFIAHPQAYLRDPWNWIDFSVVVAALLSALEIDGLKFLLCARTLRPLRSATAVPGIRNLLKTILVSVPALKDVVLLAAFLLVMFGIMGLHFWSGLLHRQCRLTSQPLHFTKLASAAGCGGWCFDNASSLNVSLASGNAVVDSSVVFMAFCSPNRQCLEAYVSGEDYYLWPIDYGQDRFCGEYVCRQNSDLLDGSAVSQALQALGSVQPGSSKVQTVCGSPLDSDALYSPKIANRELSGLNLNNWGSEVNREAMNFGLTNFDQVGASFLVVFQCMTLEGWSDIMQYAQDSSNTFFAFAYFMMLILIGCFFLVNVVLAIIWDSFCGVEADFRRRERDLAEAFENAKKAAKEKRERAKMIQRAMGLPVDEDEPEDEESEVYKAASVQRVKSDVPQGFGAPAKVLFKKLVLKRNKTDIQAELRVPSEVRVVRWARAVASSALFTVAVSLLIAANVVVLSTDGFPKPGIDPPVTEVLNYIFNAVFFIEFIILHVAVGPTVYWSDNALTFDGLIVMLSIIDFANVSSQGGGGSGPLTALRAFRMLRVFKLAKKIESMKALLKAGAATLFAMKDFVCLLTIILCVFALIAQSFFAGRFMFDPEDNTWVPPEDVATKCPMGDGGKPVCVPRAHFDTFLWSFITVFQILSGENWNAVMYDGMRSTGWPACFYFMTVMIIGNFVVLNLFLAILMASFDNERQKMAESREAEKKAKKVEDDAGPGGSKEAWGEEPSSSQGPIGVVPSGPEASASPRPKAQPRRGSVQSILANLGFGKQRDGSTKSTMGIMDAVKELAERSGFQQRCGSKSLFLFEEGSSIREAAIGLVTNPRFDHVIMVMIAASSLLMAVENPLMDPNSTTVKVLEVFNLLFTLIFLLEMVVKMIAMGVFCGQGEQPAYLGSAWNILDGAICIVSVTDTVQTFSNLASSGGIIAVMKVFRVVRMLRPLRLISRNENLKMVVKTVLGSVPELGKLLAFSSLFFVIFALLGVSNFRGSFFSCKNSALGEYSYDRGLGVTPLCIPNSTVLSLAAPGSLESMQFVALESDSGCPADFDQWRRPTVDTPVCEVHCDSDRGASNTFCQNKTRGPWGYHIMRCTDCSSSFCSEDPGKRSSCTSYCDRHEFFCTDKAAQGRSECLTQCVAQCMCEFSCVGLIQDAALCVEQGGRWVNMNQNFDDVIVGMISLFEISTTEGWVDMMLASVDSTGPYKQPRRDENEVLGTLLFVAFILIGSFFVLNLCVGVIIDNYQKQKDLQQRLMVTSAQEEWMTYLKALYLKKTFFTQVNIASLGPSRQHRYRIISSPNFENFILACIVMNTIALTMVWQPRATGEVEKVLSLVNLLFIAVFHFEAFMKISALHLNYFREFWNLFDFTCVLAGDIVSIAQASAGADGSANLGSLVSALRIFRVARLFRLIRSLKGLNKLLLAFALSVPKLLNVGLLLVLLIYLYAVLGVSLFAKVEYTGVGVYSETVNFRSFFKAVGVLIRSMTGEGWNEIMHDLSKGEFFYQSVLGLRCEVPMDFGSTPFSELDRDGDGLVDNPTECGTPLAYVYFISYTCIVTFVILNLFIAVIFEGFEESKSNEVSNFVQQCLDNWARYDRFNTMALPLGKALDFIDETVDDLLSKIPPIKRCMLEKRWDPNSSTDLFASEAMWALYNMKYVRTLGLTIRPDESVRLVVAMRAVIRRYLVSSTPAGKMLIGFEKRSKVEELEVLEQMLQDTNSPKELQDLRLLELDQSRHINYVLKLEQSTFNRFFGRSAGPSPVEEQRPSNRRMSWFQQMDKPDPNAEEFDFLEKVAAAKITRRAKENMQRRRDRARTRDKGATGGGGGVVRGPITRAAG